ncbi:MAG TPA: signal peptidase II [Candidatus Binatia bacterium]|nr:signal peptidase II [Candidatus Binatia bacterium]
MSLLNDSRIRLALGVAVVVLVLDQLTKQLVQHLMTLNETIPLLPGVALTYVRNSGAAFSMLSGAPEAVRVPLFLTVTVVAVIALISYLRTTPADRWGLIAALGGILGGAIGNFVCRVRYGEVIDFAHVYYGEWSWPMFNVADSAITVGVVVVLLASLREPAPELTTQR